MNKLTRSINKTDNLGVKHVVNAIVEPDIRQQKRAVGPTRRNSSVVIKHQERAVTTTAA